jgi:Putative transposase
VRKLFWKLPATRCAWALKLDSSVCCTPWSQKLTAHPHVHCVVPAGGLSPDQVRSRDNYFLPKKVLRKIFRGKFVDALKPVIGTYLYTCGSFL